MRLKAVLTLFAVIFSVFSPVTLHVPMLSAGPVQHFISMDICHASGHFISAATEAPALPEYISMLLAVGHQKFARTGCVSFVSALFISQIEQPPRS